jgi:hypothetical protein
MEMPELHGQKIISVMQELVYVGFFAKSLVCCFYKTILVISSSLHHYKDNSKISTSFSSLITQLLF